MEKDLAVLTQRMDDHQKAFTEFREEMKDIISSGLNGVSKAQTIQMEMLYQTKQAVDRTEIQATKTNGRVTALEDLSQIYIPEIKTLMQFRWMILGGVALITLVATIFIFMASKWVSGEFVKQSATIQDGLEEYIDDKLSAYEVPNT